MAKKCPDCGRVLKKGEVCNCKKQLIDDETKEKIFVVLEGMITKPADTMKSFAKKSNFGLSMMIVMVLSLVTGLFAMSLSKNFYILSLQNVVFEDLNFLNNIPYLKIFFASSIIMFAYSFLYTFVLYTINTVFFKRDCDYRIVYSLYGARSIITIITLLVSMVLLYINIYVGMVIALLGILLCGGYEYQSIKYLGTKDENKYGYIFLSTYILIISIVYLINVIFS